jgi:integrase
VAQIRRRRTTDGELRYDVRTRIGGRVVTRTFSRRKDADAYAAQVEADRNRGTAIDPRLSRVSVGEWCRKWLEERRDLRPKTIELYRYLLNDYVFPALGTVTLEQLSPSLVRTWHAELFGRRPAIAPKAYQVLRASLNVAVTDGLIVTNPCRVKGAGQSRPQERPLASLQDVAVLVEAIDDRYRLMVLLAYWCSLRLGELRALRRPDVDLLHGWVSVREQIVDVGGRLQVGPPKTEAGRRRVAIPPHVRPWVEAHLDSFVPTMDGLLFTGTQSDGPLPSVTWRRAWDKARSSAGLTHLHFHDLRHAGNTLAAATGASTRELMARMGHSSERAALVYQHATADRDQAIAAALSVIASQPPRASDALGSAAPSSAREARDGRAMEAPIRVTSRPTETPPEQEGGSGGAEGIRTPGLLVANQALCQLSYSPKASPAYLPVGSP